MKRSEVKKGVKVIYWKIMRKDGTKDGRIETEVTTEPWRLGRESQDANYCCCVKGVPRSVNIRNLDKVEATQ